MQCFDSLGFPLYWQKFQGICQRLTACFKHISTLGSNTSGKHIADDWVSLCFPPAGGITWRLRFLRWCWLLLIGVRVSHIYILVTADEAYFQTHGEGGRCVEKSFLLICVPGGRRGSAAGAGWQVMCAQPPLNSCWDLHKLFYNMLHIGKLGRLPMSRLSPRDPISRGGIGGARVPSLMYLYLYLLFVNYICNGLYLCL